MNAYQWAVTVIEMAGLTVSKDDLFELYYVPGYPELTKNQLVDVAMKLEGISTEPQP